jgi:transposase
VCFGNRQPRIFPPRQFKLFRAGCNVKISKFPAVLGIRLVAERLDYLWFLGYGLDDAIPNHSVLSKARARWGKAVFESFFMRVVLQCVEKGLVDGKKIHLDASLIDANASTASLRKGPPELIAALKQVYQAQESKLSDTTMPPGYEAVNDRVMSTTDPDAAVIRRRSGAARLRYHHHRAIDDAQGVITAVQTTPGSIVEQSQRTGLIDQHQANTRLPAHTVVADYKYGTVENFIAGQQRGLRTHMGDGSSKQNLASEEGIFPESAFAYNPADNTCLCPAGRLMKAGPLRADRGTWAYRVPKNGCAQCAWRAQCTRSKNGRTLHRHQHQELLDQARRQSHSPAARHDRQRRQHLMEGSFADAANNHGFKRARWRRLWRQQIQDWMIAAIQNIRILVQQTGRKLAAAAAVIAAVPSRARWPTRFCHLPAPIASVTRTGPYFPSQLVKITSSASLVQKRRFGQQAPFS